jgi:general stress protein YciG
MGLSDLVNRAKEIVQRRGGSESLKQDAEELKDIARSEGSTSDKLKKGADALKEPGAKGAEDRPGGPIQPGGAGEDRPGGPTQPGGAEQDRPGGA